MSSPSAACDLAAAVTVDVDFMDFGDAGADPATDPATEADFLDVTDLGEDFTDLGEDGPLGEAGTAAAMVD